MENVFAGLIRSLSAHLGADLKISDDGTAVNADFDQFPVLIRALPDAEQILLAVTVAQVPDGGREAFYLALLQGQYLYRSTAGGTLSLDEGGNLVCLHAVKDVRALTTENFPVFMENFLRVAEYWRKRCLEMSESPSASGDRKGQIPPASPGGLDGSFIRA